MSNIPSRILGNPNTGGQLGNPTTGVVFGVPDSTFVCLGVECCDPIFSNCPTGETPPEPPSETCVESFLVPVECVNYYITDTTNFTWDPVDNATGYNVYRAPENNPTDFVLTETNIPVSVLSIDCEYVIVTAIILDWETPKDSCTPIHFCSTGSDLEITNGDMPNAMRFYEYGTYSGIWFELPQPMPYPPVGVPPPHDYTRDLHGSGGVPPYTFSIESGILPEGMTLNPDGTIVGAPDHLSIPPSNDYPPLPPVPPYPVHSSNNCGSHYPIVFKIEDSAGHISYSSKTIIVEWNVHVQGTLPDATAIDEIAHGGPNTSEEFGNLYLARTSFIGGVIITNYSAPGTNWRMTAGNSHPNVSSDPEIHAIPNLLGNYTLTDSVTHDISIITVS